MRTAMITLLFNKWFELIDYCKSSKFDKDIFRLYHDEYAKSWKRLSYEQQGELTEMINERYATKL
jgi:hypothetical protein